MKRAFLSLAVGCLMVPLPKVTAAPLGGAHVSEVIQDVNLLASGAAPRKAAVNDKISEGSSVRTGGESRAELTFADLTITRLGENTVFTFREATREIHVEHGSVLLEVPPKGAEAKVSSAAATAAITGGTLMFGTGPPAKAMVLEGTCIVYPTGHPEEAATLHGGEMIMVQNGHLTKPQTFDVKAVLASARLILDFPALANLPLILDVAYAQPTNDSGGLTNQPSKDLTGLDVVTVATAASPPPSGSPPGPAPPPSEFGPPSTITSPDPYVITSGTTINTDPTITTNGVTDFGKIYRDATQDGPAQEFLYGSSRPFDSNVFSNTGGDGPYAVFKFSDLQLTGDPTITVPTGGATNLALVGVGSITSGAPGGTLTFPGMVSVFIGTQDGSINLGPEISFSGQTKLEFYARGDGSNLTLASPISTTTNIKLYAEGTIQVNGDESTANFKAISNGDFLAGTGTVTATNVDIESLNGNVNIDGSKFPNPPSNGGSFVLNAANTLNVAIVGGGQPFGWDSLTATAATINLTSATPVTFDFSNSSSVTFTAGTGGINAPNIDFVGSPSNGWSLTSGGSISIHSLNTEDATISAATSFTAAGDVTGAVIGSTLTAGTTVDVGGNLFVLTLTAGGNINVGNGFIALNVDAPSSILTVQGNIGPFGGPASLQYTYNVDSIVAPAGINFSFNGTPNFVGKLTINANTLTFDSATGIAFANFDGVNADEFGSGNPAEGGDGGTFIVNANGNITANSGANITATTGLNSAAGVYSGAGGSVTLLSTGGMVTVNDTIQVSSNDSAAPRQSASGGTIDLQSNLTTGTGITVGANGQLLSQLNANAPGPGGSITLSTMGSNIVVNGTITADRGTITMDQNDPAGSTPTITIDGATITANTLTINGAGDVSIGLGGLGATINVNTLSISAPGMIQSDVGGLLANAATITATGGGDVDLQFSKNVLFDGAVRFQTQIASGVTTNAANVTLGVSGNYENDSQTDYSLLQVTNNGHIGTGGNINVDVSGNLTATGPGGGTAQFQPGDFAMVVQNTNAQIDNGGNIDLTVNGNVQVNGLSALLLNYDESSNPAGHIGTGGNVSVVVDGNLTARYVDTLVLNRGGGIIGSGGSLTFTVDGTLTTTGDAGFVIETRFDNTANGSTTGSTIGSAVTLQISASSVNIGGSLSGTFFNPGLPFSGISNRGSTINGDATYEWDVANAMTIGGTAPFMLLNDGNAVSDIRPGGTIQGSALLQVVAGSFSASGFMDEFGNVNRAVDAEIKNQNGGLIDGDATLNFDATGDITANNGTNAPGDAFFLILNQQNSSGLAGGSIVGSAALTITAANISVAGDFDAKIDNFRGSGAPGPNGGSIDGVATLSITAASLSAGGELDVDIDNRNAVSGTGTGGSIQGNAAISVNLSGDLTTTGFDSNSAGTPGNANFIISNENSSGGSVGGLINGNASISVNANNISTAGSFDAEIDNYNGGTITGNASISVGANVSLNATGNVTVSGANGITLGISNAGGSISGGMAGDGVSYTVGGTTSTPGLTLFVDNTSSGVIHTGGNLTLNTTGPVMLNGGEDMEVDNYNGGSITNGANVTAHFVGDVTDTVGAHHSLNFYVLNGAGFFNPSVTGGTITTGGNIDVTFDGNAETTPTSNTGSFGIEIDNGGGVIGTGGNISLTVGGNVAAGGQGFFADIDTQGGQITNGGNITVNVTGGVNSIGVNTNDGLGLNFDVLNQGGQIASGASVAVNVGGNITSPNGAFFGILNQAASSNGGSIGSDASVTVSAANISTTGGPLEADIDNSAGTINGNATVQVGTSGNVTADSVSSSINNNTGSIGGDAKLTLNLSGASSALAVPNGTASFYIGNLAGTIGGGADVDVTAASISTNVNDTFSLFARIDNGNSTITNGATVSLTTTGSITAGTFVADIESSGGQIGGAAEVDVTAASISTNTSQTDSLFARVNSTDGGKITDGATVSLTTTGDVTSGELDYDILNDSGTIGSAANVQVQVGGNLNVSGQAFVDISNTGGSIGSDATVNVTANSISSSSDFSSDINNGSNGSIGGNASITLNVTGSFSSGGTAFFEVANNPGTITSSASVDVNAASISATNFLEAFIDNSNGTIGTDATVQIGTTGNVNAGNLSAIIFNSGGSIGGDADIAMNIAGTATVTNNATIQIIGNDPGGTASIEFNGGSYQVGGTFLNTIDGNGSITFTNTDVHANVVKVGVFGANGSVIIGGSGSNTISADTILKLYAPGSNGLLKFVANVTLSSGTVMDLAAKTITINPGVTVSIAGAGGAANVYTDNPNYNFTPGGGYTGPPPNTSNGSFGGTNGAKDPQPLINAPGFNDSMIASNASTSPPKAPTPPATPLHIGNSGQLLSMLANATPGSDGKITVPASTGAANSKQSSASGHSGANGSAVGTQNGAKKPQTLSRMPPTRVN